MAFQIPDAGNRVFLTFDDGPVPELCDFILDQLAVWKAGATFFLVGENVVRHPDYAARIAGAGHRIGNHTHNHLNGFATPADVYLENAGQAAAVLQPYLKSGQIPLFRPPYGKITPQQARRLRAAGFRLVMWDVLSKDYDSNLPVSVVVENTLRHSEPGSIVVLHDNLKAGRNIREGLPLILKGLQEKGLRPEALPDNF